MTVPFAGWLTIAKVSATPLGPLAESVPETALFSGVVTEPFEAVGAATAGAFTVTDSVAVFDAPPLSEASKVNESLPVKPEFGV